MQAAGAVAGHEEFVATGEGHFYGGAGLLGEEAGELAFDADTALGAETAAHVVDDSDDFAFVEPEDSRGVAGDGEGALRGAVDGGGISTAIIDDDDMRFEAGVMEAGRAVFGFDEHVGGFDRVLDGGLVSGGIGVADVVFHPAVVGIDRGGTGLHGLIGGDGVGEDVVFDVDGVDGIFGDFGGDGGDGGDGVAFESEGAADLDAGVDGFYAGDFLGGGEIELGDAVLAWGEVRIRPWSMPGSFTS